jgi:hypothetical protein
VDVLLGDRRGVGLDVRLRLGLGLADRASPRDARCGERVAVGDACALGLGLAVDPLVGLTTGGCAAVVSLLASSVANTPPSPPVVTETATRTAATSAAAVAGTR